MNEQERLEYLEDEWRNELARIERDERQDREDFAEWSAARADYLESLGVPNGYSNDD